MIARERSETPVADKILWNVSEAAQALGVSVRTVWRLKAEHGLPFTMLGNSVRFIPEEIKKYCLDRQEQETVSA